jgi:2-C-methyl-D-erythritol 4-phosphate cytidylyltransferase
MEYPIIAVILAAGKGLRMGGSRPKQYLLKSFRQSQLKSGE